MYIHICIYMCVCACMYVYIYAYVYIYIFKYECECTCFRISITPGHCLFLSLIPKYCSKEVYKYVPFSFWNTFSF